jgi:hypothetical protein
MVKIFRFVYLLFLLFLLSSYSSIKNETKALTSKNKSSLKVESSFSIFVYSNFIKEKWKEAMNITTRNDIFEEIINIPWGSEKGLPEYFVGDIQFGVRTNKVLRKLRAPVRLRVDPWGGINVLVGNFNNDPKVETWLYRFSSKGKLINHFKIQSPKVNQESWRIVDYVVDQAGYIYLIETTDNKSNKQNYLRKLTSGGKLVWIHSGILDKEKLDYQKLRGNFTQLLIDNKSRVYLSTTEDQGLILKVSSTDGKLEPYINWRETLGDKIFMDGQGKIYNQPSSNVIGIDDKGRQYQVDNWDISRINKGKVSWCKQINNIILQSDNNAIYIFQRFDFQKELHIQKLKKADLNNQEIKLVLPDNLIPNGGRRAMLIYIDEQENYYIYAGETPREDGTMFVYSSLGKLKSYKKPAPPFHLFQFRLQTYDTWNVDLEGNIYLPILGPKSFHVIKITPHDQAQ